MPANLWWIRRDFRLKDNPALAAAAAGGATVVPVFVLDPFFERSPYVGEKRTAFMLAGLRALNADLRARGSRLIVRRGRPEEALAALAAEVDAAGVYAQEDASRAARTRDGRAGERLPLTLTEGGAIRPPGAVRKADGSPYTVFTPYSRAWKALPSLPGRADLIPAPGALPAVPPIASAEIPSQPALPEAVPFMPGEAAAQRRLAAFTTGDDAPIFAYHDERDMPALDATSGLSPYLRWGMLSAREAAVAAYEATERAPDDERREGPEKWLDELIWREFFTAILYHFPRVLDGNFRPEYDAIDWRDDAEGFAAWCEGRTGYPIVDAAMRQLTTSGWMHNRGRMLVASFLVKDLLIDWRRGERFFMQHLLDGDPAANNGGWQWSAGTGTDAAPYFRIFNPTTQGKRYDPDGAYIRRWLPELAAVSDAYIHRPAAMPADVQQAAGCIIGQDYPAPIVDHGMARQRTLEAFQAAREAG